MDSFRAPDLHAPLDLEEVLAAAPATGTIRGMFFGWVYDELERLGQTAPKKQSYVAFKMYPIADYLGLLVEAAALAYPTLPVRERIRRLGERVYPNFAATMVGRAIFAVAGTDFPRVVELGPRAYKVSVDVGRCTIAQLEEGHAIAQFRDLWTFTDCFQVGVWQGAMQVCGVEGEILTRVHSLCDVDFDVRWRRKSA